MKPFIVRQLLRSLATKYIFGCLRAMIFVKFLEELSWLLILKHYLVTFLLLTEMLLINKVSVKNDENATSVTKASIRFFLLPCNGEVCSGIWIQSHIVFVLFLLLTRRKQKLYSNLTSKTAELLSYLRSISFPGWNMTHGQFNVGTYTFKFRHKIFKSSRQVSENHSIGIFLTFFQLEVGMCCLRVRISGTRNAWR